MRTTEHAPPEAELGAVSAALQGADFPLDKDRLAGRLGSIVVHDGAGGELRVGDLVSGAGRDSFDSADEVVELVASRIGEPGAPPLEEVEAGAGSGSGGALVEPGDIETGEDELAPATPSRPPDDS